jgi:putative transposase
MDAVVELAPRHGVSATCQALGVPRATYYRQRAPMFGPRVRRPSPPRRLSDSEREAVLEVLHEPRFVDLAVPEVHATLLEEGRYLCSVRTMYRVLDENAEVRERRNQLRHPNYTPPQLLATGPNQVWSWDITKLLGPTKWVYYYLYVILDIYSRYVVGWMLAERESGRLAEKLIAETCRRQGILPGELTIHADRGASMKSKPVVALLAQLDVERTHSRPHVSNDNPFSEAQFKTLKYQPGFPARFGGFEDGHAHCVVFFPWYNDEHHHSALAWLTPADVHYGRATALLARRAEVLAAAYAAHPERFPHGPPAVPSLPEAVWINPPKSATNSSPVWDDASATVLPAGPLENEPSTLVSLH